MSETFNCPYCRSKIDTSADVCPHCRREIRRLVAAELRVRQLEAVQMPAGVATPAPSNSVTAQIVLVFYLLATLAAWLDLEAATRGWTASESISRIVLVLMFVIEAAAAVALVFFSERCRAFHLFFVGFGQPAATIVTLFALRVVSFEELSGVALPAVSDGLQAATVMTLVGIAVAVLVLGKPVELGWSAVWSGSAELDRFEQLALKVSGIATPLLTLGAKYLPVLIDYYHKSSAQAVSS